MARQPPEWTIEFYANIRGESTVAESLNGLAQKDQAKVYNCLRLLGELGTKVGMPHARPISGHPPLWELRPGAIRVIYFAHTGRRFIILHAFRKTRRKTPSRHFTTAERRMAEFLEREK